MSLKRRWVAVLVAAVLCLGSGCTAAPQSVPPSTRLVVTTLLPATVFTLNLIQGVPDITVQGLSQPETGCMHDYQLQPQDLRLLNQADLLLLNGAGMEASFLDKVTAQYPQLPQVDTSSGMALLPSSVAHDHEEHEGHDHDHDVNSHLWMSVDNAMRQVHHIADALCSQFPQDQDTFRRNESAYVQQLSRLNQDMQTALQPYSGRSIVTYHDAFAYLAQEQGLTVVATLVADPEDTPSTRALAELVDVIRAQQPSVVFTEPGASTESAQTLARETGIRVASLDPITRGEPALDTYEVRQRTNLKTLLEAFAS